MNDLSRTEFAHLTTAVAKQPGKLDESDYLSKL